MADDLRDRIAAAIATPSGSYTWEVKADAVLTVVQPELDRLHAGRDQLRDSRDANAKLRDDIDQLRGLNQELNRRLAVEQERVSRAKEHWLDAEAERDRHRAAWQSARRRAAEHLAGLNAGARMLLNQADERDGAYRERAQLLAWLASLYPAILTPDLHEPGWQILYLTAGGQQLSWHIHPRDAELFAHVEQVPADDPRAQWDGHTKKYQRIQALADGTAERAAADALVATVQAQRERGRRGPDRTADAPSTSV